MASAEGYTPRATQLIEAAREQLAGCDEIAAALAENLPAPKLQSSRRRRRRKRRASTAQQGKAEAAKENTATKASAEKQPQQGAIRGAGENGPTDAVAAKAAPETSGVIPLSEKSS